MAMTAHVVYPAVDDLPATLSPRMIAAIRQDIGFDGLLMTDDLSMKALAGDLPDLTRAALDAGCDVALLCNAPLEDRRAVAEAAGRMTPAAQARATAALACRRLPDPVDLAALDAQLATIMSGSGSPQPHV